jgi:hypothetical protein
VSNDDRPYIETVLNLYLSLPETPSRTSRYDRKLAADLCDRKVSMETIEAAFLLASARRLFRDPALATLQPIRSLRYFLPVIEEVSASPLSPDYVKYLRLKLAPLLDQGSVTRGKA